MTTNIEPFFIEKEAISPGGKAAIGLKNKGDNHVLIWCIGSAENFRDAKACAIKNIKSVLKMVVELKEEK